MDCFTVRNEPCLIIAVSIVQRFQVFLTQRLRI